MYKDIPKTFFVEKLGDDAVDIYIDKQKQIEVIKKDRIIMLWYHGIVRDVKLITHIR